MSSGVRIEDHFPLVRKLAAEVRRSLGNSVEFDDLFAYGTKGLVEAHGRFDPNRGFAFSTFAYYRIKGAIYDGVREMGWRSRSRAQKQQVCFEHGANLALQQVADEAPAAGGADDADAVERAITQVATAYLVSVDTDAIHRTPDPSPDPEAQLSASGEGAHVRAALGTLPEKERRLVELMYFEDKSLTEAGAAIGLSKSWACRLHARALRLLSEELASRGVTASQLSGGLGR